MSAMISIGRKEVGLVAFGGLLGVLGTCLVRWLSQRRETRDEKFYVLNFKENGMVETLRLTPAAFPSHVSFDELNAVRKSQGWGERSPALWRSILDDTKCMVVLKKEARLIACGSYMTDGRNVHIVDILVRPDLQRQGYGTQVMNFLIEQIKAARIHEEGKEKNKYFAVTLSSEAPEFYARFGFKAEPAMKALVDNLSVIEVKPSLQFKF